MCVCICVCICNVLRNDCHGPMCRTLGCKTLLFHCWLFVNCGRYFFYLNWLVDKSKCWNVCASNGTERGITAGRLLIQLDAWTNNCSELCAKHLVVPKTTGVRWVRFALPKPTTHPTQSRINLWIDITVVALNRRQTA